MPTPLPTTKEAFTQFAAGTFYGEMLSSLHKSHTKPAYFHGGQAEDLFRSQLDRQIADDLAAKHGEQFVGPLYDNFSRGLLSAPRA